MYKHKNNNKKRNYLIFTGLITVALLSIALYFLLSSEPSNNESSNLQSGAGEAEVKQEPENTQINSQTAPANDPKNNVSTNNNEGDSSTEDGAKKDTNVIITDASQYGDDIEVRAFMPSIVESGTCTVEFKKGTEEFRVEEAAYADATTTICTNSLIKRDMFPSSGNWTVTVSYSSDNYSGVSEERIVEIQ